MTEKTAKTKGREGWREAGNNGDGLQVNGGGGGGG